MYCCDVSCQGLPGPDGREGIPGLPGSKVPFVDSTMSYIFKSANLFILVCDYNFRAFRAKVELQVTLVDKDFL